MKRGEKRSEPPEAAKEIFAIVDLLPPGLELSDQWELYLSFCQDDPDGRKEQAEGWYHSVEECEMLSPAELLKADIEEEFALFYVYGFYSLKALRACVEGLPEEFVNYIDLPRSDPKWLYNSYVRRSNRSYMPFEESYESFLENADGMPDGLDFFDNLQYRSPTNEACRRYRQARNWYTRLYHLADFLQTYVLDGESPYRDDPVAKVFRIDNIAVINERISFEPDRFTDAFLDVSIHRIRRCANCGRVFWAKRDDMKGCSLSCAKILRTRKWREKTTEEQRRKYKINRIKKEETKGEN